MQTVHITTDVDGPYPDVPPMALAPIVRPMVRLALSATIATGVLIETTHGTAEPHIRTSHPAIVAEVVGSKYTAVTNPITAI